MAVWICIGHGTSYDHHHRAKRVRATTLCSALLSSRSVSTNPPSSRAFYLTLGLKCAPPRGGEGKEREISSRRQPGRGSIRTVNGGIGRGSKLDRVKSCWLIVVAVPAVAIAINSFALRLLSPRPNESRVRIQFPSFPRFDRKFYKYIFFLSINQRISRSNSISKLSKIRSKIL